MKRVSLNLIARLFIGMPILLAGCSQDVASVDDVPVPTLSEERFPITVREMPVKLTLEAGHGPISAEDSANLVRYAHGARRSSSSPIYVSYPARSATARAAMQEAVHILKRSGVDRSAIRISSYDGTSDVVSLRYTRQVAVSEPCGNWSRSIANDGRNEAYPNFGCTAQNNLAAMVANPEDFQRPRTMTDAPASGRMSAMKTYESGEWSKEPVELPSAAGATGSQ